MKNISMDIFSLPLYYKHTNYLDYHQLVCSVFYHDKLIPVSHINVMYSIFKETGEYFIDINVSSNRKFVKLLNKAIAEEDEEYSKLKFDGAIDE